MDMQQESDSKAVTKTSPLRIFAAACMIAVGFCFVAGFYYFSVSQKAVANKDFIAYWAAGRQLVRGANPYDDAAVLRLEQAVGLEGATNIMFNPPLAFFLVIPLGLVGAKFGFVLWSMVILSSLSIANWLLWIVYGSPGSRLHLLGYLFAPALACLLAGQLGTFLLLGVVLFLWLYKSHPYLAGTSLLLCALKPHLYLPFFLVLALWSIHRKEFRILAGFFIALLVDCAFSLGFDIHAWQQYSQMMRTEEIVNQFVPTLSVAFRLLVDPNLVWLQFLPEACGCIWAGWYFWSRRDRWDWTDQGLLLLLVSALCTPRAWFSDETMLLPAVLVGLFRAVKFGRSVLPLVLFAGAALFELHEQIKMTTPYYLWTVPAWLAWYLYASTPKRVREQPANAVEESLV